MATSFTVTKRFRFYAAHRNTDLCGKCESIHGHCYVLLVTVAAPKLSSVTISFADVEAVVAPLVEEMDHSLLLWDCDPARPALVASGACNKVFVVPFQTSCENMAEYILSNLRTFGLNVVSLTLQETETSSVTVTP
jgi:6-pyruvoyltetrahydropterin/6-carboxytetrahydropterin synthase